MFARGTHGILYNNDKYENSIIKKPINSEDNLLNFLLRKEISMYKYLEKSMGLYLPKIYETRSYGSEAPYIIMELVVNNLKDIIGNESVIHKFAKEGLKALKILHSIGQVHGDIKYDNILYNVPDNRFVLIDLATMSRFIKPKGIIGTPMYMSKHLKTKCFYIPAYDIESFGYIILFLKYGLPWANAKSMEEVSLLKNTSVIKCNRVKLLLDHCDQKLVPISYDYLISLFE